MEFPHGRHHHHQRGEDDEEERRPPPEYGYGEEGYSRPPPPRQEYEYGGEGYGHPPPPRHEYGHGEGAYGHPPPPRHEYAHGDEGYGRPPPPQPEYGYGQPAVQHVSHVSHQPAPHGGYGGNDAMETLMRQPTYRIYCKANDGVSLAIRDGTVLLVTANERDLSQHWIKDMKYSTKVKDEEGYPAFALINKATCQALKHSLGKSHPVQVMGYNPVKLEESVLWTESRDVGSGFRCIRMVNNIYLNFDALHGDKAHGGVHDGTTLVLWEWCEGDNQRWKIVPWSFARCFYYDYSAVVVCFYFTVLRIIQAICVGLFLSLVITVLGLYRVCACTSLLLLVVNLFLGVIMCAPLPYVDYLSVSKVFEV